MKLALAKSKRAPAGPTVVALSPLGNTAMILHGIASDDGIDRDAMMFEPGSLYWDVMPPLYCKHNTSCAPVGTVDSLAIQMASCLLALEGAAFLAGRFELLAFLAIDLSPKMRGVLDVHGGSGSVPVVNP